MPRLARNPAFKVLWTKRVEGLPSFRANEVIVYKVPVGPFDDFGVIMVQLKADATEATTALNNLHAAFDKLRQTERVYRV